MRIITNNNNLSDIYHDLSEDDLFVGRLRIRPGEEYIILDLENRGVQLFPPAISQWASRSKAFQALLLGEYMVPHTSIIHNVHDLMSAIGQYNKYNIGSVVTKRDRANGGQGINLWRSVEDVYNQTSYGAMLFPFVLQPYFKDSLDIRAIILGDYLEAYERFNPNNFRNNLHCGGTSRQCELDEEQWNLCHLVMKRAQFPYAHVDLLISKEGKTFLGEINLGGGLYGARIKGERYQEKLNEINNMVISTFTEKYRDIK